MNIKSKLNNSGYFNKALFTLSKKSLDRNLKFRDLHEGETCYIFGNGESIKSMDLKNFSDKVSIGCNNLFLHKDFGELDCRYYQIVAPFIFMPYFKYRSKQQRNHFSSVYKDKIKSLNGINFFTSIFNKFHPNVSNVYYEHHFGVRTSSIEHCDLTGTFSFLSGATEAMIGLAIYMGFKKAILVGVDYTFSDSISHHFFEKGRGDQENQKSYNEVFFEHVRNKIDLLTITLEGDKSDSLEYISYSNYTGENERYRDNIDCIDKENLDTLDNMGLYKIW